MEEIRGIRDELIPKLDRYTENVDCDGWYCNIRETQPLMTGR